MQPLAISVTDAAQMIGLGKTRTWALIASGQLATVRIGRRTLVKVESLRALVDGIAA